MVLVRAIPYLLNGDRGYPGRDWLWRYCGVTIVWRQERKTRAGNLASNGFGYSNLRIDACPVRGPVFPFKYRFSPFGPPGFLVCHRPSSLMLKEYRLTHRGILVSDAAVPSRFNRMKRPVSKREQRPMRPAG